MTSIAQITAWRLWRKNRFLLLFVLAHIAVVTLISYTLFRSKPIEYRGWCVLSLAYSLQFLLPMFTYVDGDFDLADPHSKFPAHLFTLPLRTNQFVFWPMFYGAVCFAAFWIFASRILTPPLGIVLPRFWPAAALAALIASLQTVVWCPLGFPFARIALALAFPGGILAAAAAGFVLHLQPAALLALFLLLIPFCYLISVRGLSAERRGDSPDWRFSLSSISPTALFPKLFARKPPKPFRSPQAAQLWLEWHRNGVTSPLLMLLIAGGFGILGFFIRQPAPLGIGEIQVSFWVKAQLGLLLLFPLMFGQSAGADRIIERRPGRPAGFPPFLAIRPMTSATFVTVKLKRAALSTLATWAICFGCAALWLLYPATEGARSGPLIYLLWPHLSAAPIIVAIPALILAIVWSWLLQVQALAFHLVGRPWVSILLNVLLPIVAMMVFWGVAIEAVADPQTAVLRFTPWVPSVLFILTSLKIFVAAIVLRALWRQRALNGERLEIALLLWLLFTAAAFGLFSLSAPITHLSRTSLAMAAVLTIPFSRLLAGPAALHFNRHR